MACSARRRCSSAARARSAAPADGVPAVSDDAASEPGVPAGVHGARPSLVAMPVLRDGRCSAVVAWYF